VINQRYAAWDEGVTANGISEIVVLNLRTGARTIARQGHPGWIALTSDSLVWAESPHAGAETIVHAVSLATGKQAHPPPALAHLRGAWGFTDDQGPWAWVAGATEAVYIEDPGGKAMRIGNIPQGGASPPVAAAAGAFVVPVSAGGIMLVNLHTKAWAYLHGASYAVSNGTTQLLVSRTATKTAGGAGASPIATLKQGELSSLACSAGS
jgi:hypothetical protein